MSEKPKSVMLQAEMRRRLITEYLIISEMVNPGGRPKHSLLGTERRQMDLLLGVRVMILLEEECARERKVMDPAMAMYLTDRGRRVFVGGILNSTSRFNLILVDGAPIETLYKSSGKFIRIRATEPQSRNGAGRYRYVAKHTASPLEVRAAYNTQREEAETRAGIVTDRLQAFAVALQAWPNGAATFEQAFAIEAAARLQRP